MLSTLGPSSASRVVGHRYYFCFVLYAFPFFHADLVAGGIHCGHARRSSHRNDVLTPGISYVCETKGLTKRCSRRLAGLFPSFFMTKILPELANRALARRG